MRRSSRTRVPKSATNGHILRRPDNGELGEFWTFATCEQIDCQAWRNGWEVAAAAVTDQHHADFARWRYRYATLDLPDNAGRLLFEPGQVCFDARTDAAKHGHPTPAHRVPLEREPLYVLRNPLQGARQVGQAQWVDTLHENTDRVATLRARG